LGQNLCLHTGISILAQDGPLKKNRTIATNRRNRLDHSGSIIMFIVVRITRKPAPGLIPSGGP